ncbi:MAG: hypothetical protein ACREYD_04385 [Casimicrobiaceae bacterium]
MLRSLIRQNAADGSFDSGLAADSAQSLEFFDKLKRALVHGYFIEEDRQTGRVASVAVPGYVFWPDDRHSGHPPAGFGLFRAIAGGYELWLAALELGRRGGGHGRAMIDSLFATPPGRKTWIVRIPRDSRYRATVEHLLRTHSFDLVGDTTRLRWFLRSDAPAALAMSVRGAVNGNPPLA